MKYRSAKGTKEFCNLSFEDTLFTGWLKDGGLCMPESIPKLTAEQLKEWSGLTYKELCLEVLKMFIDDDFIGREELKDIISTAYSQFPSDVVPIKELYDQAFVAELFHGQTHAFKDLAMAISSALLNYALEKRNKHGIVYVCTSGDTGSSVIHSVKGLERIDAIVMYPGGDRINKLQRLLMTTVMDDNVHIYAGDCFCDPLDIFFQSFSFDVMEKFPDIVVTTLNSVVFIRVLAQTVHLMFSYFQVTKNLQSVKLVIPTGGCGHITSAVMLQKMGLPLTIVPVFNNKNLNTYNFLTGKELIANAPVSTSMSVAMDIQYPTNMQRLIYMWTDYNSDVVKTLMEDFSRGTMKLPVALLEKIHQSLSPAQASDEIIKDTMKRCYEDKGYSLDPHTAIGFSLYYKEKQNMPTIFAGCASPVKFSETLSLVGIPLSAEHKNIVDKLYMKEERYKVLPADQTQWAEIVMKDVEDIVKKWNARENQSN